MQHLNYCRQLAKWCKDRLEIPSLDAGFASALHNVLDLHGASTKFLLPDGGRVFDDQSYRALDETQPLRLPYKYIALEYSCTRRRADDETIPSWDGPIVEDDNFRVAPKRVIFARERDDWIVTTIAYYVSKDDTWCLLPECALPTTGYLDRSKEANGKVPMMIGFSSKLIPPSDYMDELGALLCFLNVLQCSNVHVERSHPKKQHAKVKGALPFDTYHLLTIDSPGGSAPDGSSCSHRSPREHLRRGHIRRLADGRRIWVNATVVSAGRGSGVITKDYALRIAA